MKAWWILWVAVLSGCEAERTAMPVEGGNPDQTSPVEGGNPQPVAPVEGGNPVLAARVVSSNGAIRAGVAVKLWEIADDSIHQDTFCLLGRSVSDAEGIVHFRGKENRPWVMVVDDSLEGASLEGYGATPMAGQLSLARWGSVRGTWKGAGRRPSWVGLARLPLRASVSLDGSYWFPRVPWGHRVVVPGPWSTLTQRPVLASVEVAPGSRTEVDSTGGVHSGLLIDDFENPSRSTFLTGKVEDGRWNFIAPGGDTSRIEPGTLDDFWFGTTRMGGGDGRGNAWKIRVENLDADSLQRGGVFLNLSSKGIDASALDSLSFRMRGNGLIRVSLVGSRGKVDRVFTMPLVWATVVLRPSDFGSDPALVRSALGSLQRIEWISEERGNMEFWLDDLLVHGWVP